MEGLFYNIYDIIALLFLIINFETRDVTLCFCLIDQPRIQEETEEVRRRLHCSIYGYMDFHGWADNDFTSRTS